MTKKVICPNFGRCTYKGECPHRTWHSLIKGDACLETRCNKTAGREIAVGKCIPMSKLKYELLK